MTLPDNQQTTLARAVTCEGIGVHSGALAAMRMLPAPANTGFWFRRTDITDRPNEIHAHYSDVSDAQLGTTLSNAAGVMVLTVEHVLSACVGMGLDNAMIELSGPEAPILDGSALPYARLIAEAGLVAQGVPRRTLRVLKTCGAPDQVPPSDEQPWVRFAPHLPGEGGLKISVDISFSHPAIGRQSFDFALSPEAFLREIAPARTFGFLKDVTRLHAAGRALGASLANTIVLSDSGIANPEGLRFPDEFVRHKVLDAIGDLALLGARLEGRYQAFKPGHALTYAQMVRFMAQTESWAQVAD
jgi:UDP-3-O-[3-hydroxymyristoyl] N-acetylglucosamine deacetylase